MKAYDLVLAILGVWRMTHLLQAEDGPWALVARLRRAAGEGFWGDLLDCFYCLSLWIAAPFAAWLGDGAAEKLLLWPALSAAAIVLERVLERFTAPPPPGAEIAAFGATYWKEEDNDDLLRQEERRRALDERPGP